MSLVGCDTSERRTNCGDCGDDFTELELIEDGRLAGSIETDHKNSWTKARQTTWSVVGIPQRRTHLLFAEEGLKGFAKCHTHGCWSSAAVVVKRERGCQRRWKENKSSFVSSQPPASSLSRPLTRCPHDHVHSSRRQRSFDKTPPSRLPPPGRRRKHPS